MKPYQMHSSEVIKKCGTDIDTGLSLQQVRIRQQEHGYNILADVEQRTILSIFISQFRSPLIYILFCAALIIFFIGEDALDAFIITGILLFNAVLGTIQEARTKNILDSLKQFIKTESVVLRDGKKTIVEDNDLVIGDIILLQEGQQIPADARIIESNNLTLDEAVLTGESQVIRKYLDALQGEVALGDQTNMLFRGTYIVAGSGKAVVVAIGSQTEIGTIHSVTQDIKTDIPLRKELDHLVHLILLFIIGFCLFLFGLGFLTGEPWKELLIMLTALFICVVPEGLPVVLTLVMVTGAHQMAKQFVLVKNLQAVDTLGRTNKLLIDKTGTLTRNEMIVSTVFADDIMYTVTGQGYHSDGEVMRNGQRVTENNASSVLYNMAIAAKLLNSTEIIYAEKQDLFTIKGDRTEAAMYVFAKKCGITDANAKQYKKVYEIPFSSDLHYHAGFFKNNDNDNECIAFIIGSPEAVMQRCDKLSSTHHEAVTRLLDRGLRVIAVGMKTFATGCKMDDSLENFQKQIADNVQFLGLFGIEDSIRFDVKNVIEKARDAGLSIVMITGDHKKTALYVADKVAIYRESDDVIDGPTLAVLSDEQLRSRIGNITVFARMTAMQKLRVVTMLQRQGYIVAMTGDGINDAPSLAAADLGIAMGGIGTEVARQASDLVLLHDSFETIIAAIEQGRHVFYTLRRVVLYFFSTNMAEILIVLFALLVGLLTGKMLPLPLTAVQILWLNLVTDGFLDSGLSMEPKERGLLSRQWLEKKKPLVDWPLVMTMVYMAVPMAAGSLALFMYYAAFDLMHARTMTLITMAMYQWFNVLNCRSLERSLFLLGFFENKWLIVSMTFVFCLQLALLYIPFMQHTFKTVPLSLHDWSVIIMVTVPIIFIEEIRKLTIFSNIVK